MGFPRHKYWCELRFPFTGDLPNQRIEPVSPAVAGGFFTSETPGKPLEPKLEYQQIQQAEEVINSIKD